MPNRLAIIQAAAEPPPIRRSWLGRLRRVHAAVRGQAGRTQAAYLSVLVFLG